jgi:Kelch motif/Galactose oxidase, central domain
MLHAAGSLITPRYEHTATLLSTGKVLVAGGNTNTLGGQYSVTLNTAELYDPGTNTWSAAAAMPFTAQQHTATLLANGTVIIAGGVDTSTGYASGGTALYTPATNTWSQLATMNDARIEHAAMLLSNGQILITGGVNAFNLYYPVGPSELYNPANNTWTVAAPLNLPRYQHSSTALSDGRVMIVGGTPGYIPEFWKP